MAAKYYVEVYDSFQNESGQKQFKLLQKKEFEAMQDAKDKIVEWVKAGHAEENVVLYVVQNLAFKVEYSVKVE